MTSQLNKLGLTIILLMTMASCHFNSQYINREADKNDAEQVTNKFYELLQTKDYEGTIQLFSENFFEVADTGKLFKLLSMTNKKLGTLKTTEIEAWETQCIEGSNPSAKYTLVYKNMYDSFPAIETIILTKEKDGQIKIASYHINSDVFLNN